MICNECETVAHCTKHGCVPKQPAPVQEPVAWRKFNGFRFDYIEHQPALSGMVSKEWKPLYDTTPPAQPAHVQPVQEADVFDDDIEVTGPTTIRTRYRLEVGTKLYTTQPAAQQAVPLTDEQIRWNWSNAHNDTTDRMAFEVFARAIEAAHGITKGQQ